MLQLLSDAFTFLDDQKENFEEEKCSRDFLSPSSNLIRMKLEKLLNERLLKHNNNAPRPDVKRYQITMDR